MKTMERRKSQKQEALKQLAYQGIVSKDPTPEVITSYEQGRKGFERPKSPELGFDSKGGKSKKRRSRKHRKTLRRSKRH